MKTQNLGLFLIRSSLALVFVYHGSQKLFGAFGGPGLDGFAGFLTHLGVPFPQLNAPIAASIEFFGGLALLAGVAPCLAPLFITLTMAVAALTAHSGFNAQTGGMEYPLTLAFVTAGLGLIGPGAWTLPAVLAQRQTSPGGAALATAAQGA